jgi:hypothetical protein
LIDGVAHLDEVGFEHGVEAGHEVVLKASE